ncbi:MAG: hypothetical protein K2N88_02910 [Muribaculaceae bacterium]|nr:hypothetical protein [Muribaculaceae bacterium]
MFSLTFEPLVIVLLAVAAFGALIALTYGLHAYRKAADFVNPPLPPEDALCPKATVLIYCQSDEEVLTEMLDALAQQDYPDYEAVVVCEATPEYAEILNEKYSKLYTDVYVTFMLPGSHNVSRRKLAITIGVKAAKGEVIVNTVANVTIPSTTWLSSMMAPFCGESGKHKDVVLGLSRIDFTDMKGPGKWFRQFDSVLTNALWVGYAASGHPYRGDGYNLAFRRETFFRHKGYARSINLHYGDDDIFINEIATPSNTAVVVSDDSIIETNWGDSANRVWSILKERYWFTSRWLPRAPFVQASMMPAMAWLVLTASVGAALVALPNLMAAVIGLVINLLLFWGEISCYRRLASRFGAVRLWWGVVPFWLWRPVANAVFKYDHRHSSKKNFTWQR